MGPDGSGNTQLRAHAETVRKNYGSKGWGFESLRARINPDIDGRGEALFVRFLRYGRFPDVYRMRTAGAPVHRPSPATCGFVILEVVEPCTKVLGSAVEIVDPAARVSQGPQLAQSPAQAGHI
jgi:hypothetical protein